MGLTGDSKLGEIAADPKGAEILEKHVPGLTEKAKTVARFMTLKQVVRFSGGKLNDDVIKAIDEDLRKL